MTFRLDFYTPDELATIVRRSARASSASRSRPRRPTRSPAARAARRGSRTASSAGCATSPRCATQGAITTAIAARGARRCSRSTTLGLERIDRELLRAIVDKFGGGPVGLSTLAVALGEEPDTIEDVYEPYLLQLGFLQRTPRGRIVTELGRAHVGASADDDQLF